MHAHPHADTDSIIGAVRSELPAVSHQAVYDVLRALTTAGLVRRIQPSGSVARYEARVGDNHHHVVVPVPGPSPTSTAPSVRHRCLTASENRGFVIDEAEVTTGACAGLRGRPGRHRPTTDPLTSPHHRPPHHDRRGSDVSEHGSESENLVIPSPSGTDGRIPTRTGGRTS